MYNKIGLHRACYLFIDIPFVLEIFCSLEIAKSVFEFKGSKHVIMWRHFTSHWVRPYWIFESCILSFFFILKEKNQQTNQLINWVILSYKHRLKTVSQNLFVSSYKPERVKPWSGVMNCYHSVSCDEMKYVSVPCEFEFMKYVWLITSIVVKQINYKTT